MCHAILGSTFRNKTTSKLRPLTTVPRVAIFVRFSGSTVLIIRGTYYQGWFMYMRYTQGQNEEYLLSRSMY